MSLQDRHYMRRVDDDSGVACIRRRNLSSPKYLLVAAVAIPLAIGAFQLYKYLRQEMIPGEGDLVVNINTATLEELETIPDIGPVLAREIVRGRPYKQLEDLERVRGIAAYTINSIRPYAKVEGQTQDR